MIFGILRFAHFAHGDVMTLGAYGTLTAVVAIFGCAALAALAVRHGRWRSRWRWSVDRLFYRPLRQLPTIYTVISSFGVALILRSRSAIWGFGPERSLSSGCAADGAL